MYKDRKCIAISGKIVALNSHLVKGIPIPDIPHTITNVPLNIITSNSKYASTFVTHNVAHTTKRLPISTKLPNTAIILYTKPPRKQHYEQVNDINNT